jgi:2-amino-4-hydroxy-6-hydroxymethyldihydropteridine diphosphokinase
LPSRRLGARGETSPLKKMLFIAYSNMAKSASAGTYFISMHEVILSLGTNLGDRENYLYRMEDELQNVLMPPLMISQLMETEPLGTAAGQEWFLNRIVAGRYGSTPYKLLDSCQAIEKRLGRERPHKNAPRTADIDILLFGAVLLNDARLVIPHRHLADRRFCIAGLMELAPDRPVPGTGKSVRELEKEMGEDVRKQGIRFVATGTRN